MASTSSVETFLASHQDKLVQLRKYIHSHPELAFHEHKTTDHLIHLLKGLNNPPQIVQDVGGGFLAIFNFNVDEAHKGKTVIFRCELDAIPMVEKNEFEHKSINHGAAHGCGHDGHMTIVMGLAMILSSSLLSPSHGRVVLLFQPAEETGAGAQKMVESNHPVLKEMLDSPDSSIFALHNVPGFPKETIVLPYGNSFASASRGMHITLGGAKTHACQPHLGKNPALAVCNIVQGLLAMPTLHIPYDQKGLVTIVGARIGEKAFGVSAGDGEVMTTLRATTNTALEALVKNGTSLVNGIAATYGLTASISYEDVFVATINDPKCGQLVTHVGTELKMNMHWLQEAFPWSEDFGIFLQKTKGAMFGMGMGETHPPLHDEQYDFSETEINTGIKIFAKIVERELCTPQEA